MCTYADFEAEPEQSSADFDHVHFDRDGREIGAAAVPSAVRPVAAVRVPVEGRGGDTALGSIMLNPASVDTLVNPASSESLISALTQERNLLDMQASNLRERNRQADKELSHMAQREAELTAEVEFKAQER